jgi:hypothetical protein
MPIICRDELPKDHPDYRPELPEDHPLYQQPLTFIFKQPRTDAPAKLESANPSDPPTQGRDDISVEQEARP